MFGFTVDQARLQFFDRDIAKAVTRAERKVLSRFGAFVRTRARTSIRPRRKPSPPGSPPSSHVGLLRRFILFAFEPGPPASVVVGAAKLNQRIGNAPETLEHGGESEIWTGRKTPRRRVRIEARPFMAPALEAERGKLDSLWAHSIK